MIIKAPCLMPQRGKRASAYDKNSSLRNTDPPQVTIIHHIHNPLLNDSDRQTEKLLLWQAECEWQSWYISVSSHVAGATQALRRGDDSTGPHSPHTDINISEHVHWRNIMNPRPFTQFIFLPRAAALLRDSHGNWETKSKATRSRLTQVGAIIIHQNLFFRWHV